MNCPTMTNHEYEAFEKITDDITTLTETLDEMFTTLANELVPLLCNAFDFFLLCISEISQTYHEYYLTKPNNWLKMHGFPMRRRRCRK